MTTIDIPNELVPAVRKILRDDVANILDCLGDLGISEKRALAALREDRFDKLLDFDPATPPEERRSTLRETKALIHRLAAARTVLAQTRPSAAAP